MTRRGRWWSGMRAATLLAVVVLAGHVTDRTTGQPLVGVDVRADGGTGGTKVAPARTNGAGRYALTGLSPGRYTLTLSSDDVPPQRFEVVVSGGKSQRFNITACSTTLDYSCATASP